MDLREVAGLDALTFKEGSVSLSTEEGIRQRDDAGAHADAVVPVELRTPLPLGSELPFDCQKAAQRLPHETKGNDVATDAISTTSDCCGPSGACH